MSVLNDTICAPATVEGSGAICIIRVSGPKALEAADRVVDLKSGAVQSSEGYSLKMGEIRCGRELLDEVLVSIFRAPHSYTGEDGVEISCHSSSYIVRKVLELLLAAGCRMAEPGEFTQRAFLNGKMDLAQAEAVADLIAADSSCAHKIAINQLKGGYSAQLRLLRDKLVDIAALMELELDFSEEEVEFANRSQLQILLDEAVARIEKLQSSFREGNAIKTGIPVAIVGAPNCGKSTLLNALLGEDRAIVSDIPGTTRDTVEETMNLDGIRYRFIDTAGLRDTSDRIEKIGIERSREAISKAEIVLGVIDAQAEKHDAVNEAVKLLEAAGSERRLLLLRNKVDIFDAVNPEDFPTKDRSYSCFELKYPAFGTYELSPTDLAKAIKNASKGKYNPDILDISAKTGEGLDELKERISEIGKSYGATGDGILVTNLRHFEALTAALDDLYSVQNSLRTSSPTDLVAEDLRSAIRSLSSIFGEGITPDEILGTIFSRFCIGK